MKEVFVSGNVLKRNLEGLTEMVRVVSLYDIPFRDAVEEFVVKTAYEREEGGVIRKDDKQLAREIIAKLSEHGYEVVERDGLRAFQSFTKAEQTVLSGNFEARKIEKKEAV